MPLFLILFSEFSKFLILSFKLVEFSFLLSELIGEEFLAIYSFLTFFS